LDKLMDLKKRIEIITSALKALLVNQLGKIQRNSIIISKSSNKSMY
jgi:hypothetical protein